MSSGRYDSDGIDRVFVRESDMDKDEVANESYRRRLLIAETVTRIERELNHLQETVNKKQDKVGMGVILPLVGYLLTQIVVGVWWASEMTQAVESLNEKIETASEDRFYGRDGARLEQLIELKGKNYTLRLENLELQIGKLDSENKRQHDLIRDRLRDLERPDSDQSRRPYIRKPEIEEMLNGGMK